MKSVLVNFNGKIMPYTELVGPDTMLWGADYIYQRIHVMDGQPLHLDAHNEIIRRGLLSLYQDSTKVSTATLEKEIRSLVQAERYENSSVIITIFVMPPKKGIRTKATWLMIFEDQLLYKGYTLWHTPKRAVLTRYEYPFAEFPTAVAMAAHNYAIGYAERKGADIALTENYKFTITGAGPSPLFAVSRDRVFITPLEDGALDSVVRRLGIASCEAAGFKVVEQPIFREMITDFDEFFIVNQQGVASIGNLNDRPYPSSAAKVIADKMAGMTGESLLQDKIFLK